MKTIIAYLLFLLAFPFGTGQLSFASNQDDLPSSATFQLSSTETLVSAYGLLLEEPLVQTKEPAKSSDSDVQALIRPSATRKEAVIKNLGVGKWLMTVTVGKDYQPNSHLVAFATTESGNILPTEVSVLSRNRKDNIETAQCASDENVDALAKLVSLDQETLQALIEIRSMKEDVLQRQLKQILTTEALAKLSALEAQAALSSPTPFIADMPLEELVRRISALEGRLK